VAHRRLLLTFIKKPTAASWPEFRALPLRPAEPANLWGRPEREAGFSAAGLLNEPAVRSISGIRADPKAGHHTLDLMRWDLVPYWAKDIKIGFSTINTMAETIDAKPVFREAFARRRCIVRSTTSNEWRKIGPKEKRHTQSTSKAVV
jgi:hypothetical protein